LADALVTAGLQPVAQRGAGPPLGLPDDDLEAHGVAFRPRHEVLSKPLLLKYKSFTQDELTAVSPDAVLGSVFHIEGKPDLAATLESRKLRAYSYEFLQDHHGRFPLMTAGGRIAGVQAVQLASRYLQIDMGGPGLLLGPSDSGFKPVVVIIGTGNVACGAAETAIALDCDVTMLAHTGPSAEAARTKFTNATIYVNAPDTLARILPAADVVIGAILISTFDTPPMIAERDIKMMKPGAVIVDATCGYGDGYLPTAGPVQGPDDPPRVLHGVQHIKIETLPALVPLTASYAYSRAAAPYLVLLAHEIAAKGRAESWSSALISESGRIVHLAAIHTLSQLSGRS
jgi:alanine dehydrogenase